MGRPDANMELARRAGFRAIVLSSVWTPAALGARPRRARGVCAARSTPPTAPGSGRSSPSTPSARVHAADAAGARRVRLVRGGDPARDPGAPRRERRQRAELEPVLAARSSGRRHGRGRRGVLRRCSAEPTRPEGGRPARDRDRRLARRARQRQPGTAAARRTRRRASSSDLGGAFRASGRDRPPLDLFSIHPYPANSIDPADRRRPALDLDRHRRLPEARRGCSRARSARPPPIVYGEYGIQTRSRAPSSTSTSGRGRSPPAGRARRRRRLTTSRRSGSPPASRSSGCSIFFHVTDESQLSALQTGLFYPNDTAEAEPRPGRPLRPRGGRDRPGRNAASMSERAPGRPVRRLHVLQGAARVAPPAGRGARGGQGRIRRDDRGVRAALRLAPHVLDDRASGPTATSSSGRSRSATRTSASSARR